MILAKGRRNHFLSSFASNLMVRHGARAVPMHQGAYLLLLCALLAVSVGCVVWLVACSKEVPELVFAEYGGLGVS